MFRKLWSEVEKRWLEKNYNEEIFPEIAAEALREFDLPSKISVWDVVNWTLGETELPVQRDLAGKFGDPPITIYNSPRFHIDVYFWLEATTAIHQHSFCGAFQVLHGSSIHSNFQFETHERVNFFTALGELSLKRVELLNVGQIREIFAGERFIHSLFHLDYPSATVVIRTHRSDMFLPQFNYYKPSLAIDPFFEDPTTTKKLQTMAMMFRLKHPDADKLLNEFLSTADFQTTFTFLSSARYLLQGNQIEQMFRKENSQNRLAEFFAIAEKRHGSLAAYFPKIFAEQQRLSEIVERRNFVSDAEQRFFLALLLNVDGKDKILGLVKERFPEKDARETVLDWIYDLSQTRIVNTGNTNALGIEDFGDDDLFVLECLLKDFSTDEMKQNLRENYPDDYAEKLAPTLEKRSESLKNATIFQALFR